MNAQNKPKVALAFSGASSRSVFYIGFLEVLKENNFPIDYISAISGSSIVAASFACGTMDKLKDAVLELNREFLFTLIERSKTSGGFYQMDKAEQFLRIYTRNQKFEEVCPKLGIVATDIEGGELVALQVGDIAKALCASCALPGIFEPVPWGNKSLVDGGILSVVPGKVAQSSGADLVIGIDLRATRHVFSPWQIWSKRLLNRVKSLIWPDQISHLWSKVAKYSDFFASYPKLTKDYDQRINQPKLWTVLGRALDLAIKAQEDSRLETNFDCDLLIVPQHKKYPFWKKYLFLHFTDFSHTKEYYQLGRDTAEIYLPQLWQLLAEKEQAIAKTDLKLKELIEHGS